MSGTHHPLEEPYPLYLKLRHYEGKDYISFINNLLWVKTADIYKVPFTFHIGHIDSVTNALLRVFARFGVGVWHVCLSVS